LISPKFVLTGEIDLVKSLSLCCDYSVELSPAAHCLSPRSYGDVKFVKLGMSSRSQSDNATLTFGVAQIFQHPGYNKKTFNEDIGLLRLNATVPLNEYILPICMPTKLHNDGKALASGFGRTGYQQAGSEQLLKVTLEKFTHEECQQAFESAITVTNDTMLCYGHHTESKDSCSVS
jgi:secreted trypsin-like serine protease